LATDIYAVGYEFTGSFANSIAKAWKNGVATSLTNGSNQAYASSVFVLGSDVYIAGSESNGTTTVAKIWKNGVATSLTNGTNDAEAYSIFVK
jgi:CTP:molybdopterin cytidylyltransferase MocA